ncbi:MAG: flagellar hook-length control protein FliK [Oscillospiraceae bacterium]|nr:flagellar hook-length control protein FliK [Oscillospiraceae bacterium]
MQQATEILSLAPTPGSGNRQQPRTRQESSGFNQAFEQELGRSESRRTNAGRNRTNTFEPTGAEAQSRIEDDEDLDGIMQTNGAMANPYGEVIFILEGNMESATHNLNPVEEILPQETKQIISPAETQPQDANEIPQDFIKTLDEKIAAAASKQADTNQVAEQRGAETTTTAQTGAVNVEANEVKTESKLDTNPITAKDVEARMPEVTTESQENTGDMSNFSENDNLSPLENENGTNRAEQQSGKTYAETESAVSEAETPTVQGEILPPLADGIKPEQLRAAAQMSEATLNQPVKPENLFEELVERVQLMQNTTRSTMTLTLNPEHLGSVALEVAIDAAGLHVKINAEDSGVRGMINAQLAALIESLEEKGHQVVEVEVAYTGLEYNHSMLKEDPKGNNHGKSGSHSGGKNGEADKKDAVTYYTTLPDIMDYYMDTGVSSVEFSA